MKTHKLALSLIEDSNRHKKDNKILRERLDKMEKTLDVISGQTKRKTPVKRTPKPREEESEKRKKGETITAAELKKIVIYRK